jgi:hypothetical protein
MRVMHRPILGVVLIATVMGHAVASGTITAAAPESCPRPLRAVVERFIDAECGDCWTRRPRGGAERDAWSIDWIVPSARGEDAPLSAAELGAAKERADRIARALPGNGGLTQWRTPLHASSGLKLNVTAGPAWNGYIGLHFDARGAWPRHGTGWMALAEVVPAGTDGTPVPRRLMRAVAGPLELDALRDGRSAQVLRALRWPETARPERLRALAWIESIDGRIVAVAGERCPWPRPR